MNGANALCKNTVSADFMFKLTVEECVNLRSQFVTSGSGHGGHRYVSYAFTELGVAMLSSVLNSPHAIAINIEIMRPLVRLRAFAASDQDLDKRLNELQDKTESLAMSHETFSRNTRVQLRQVFDMLRELMTPPEPKKNGLLGLSHRTTRLSPRRSKLQSRCVSGSCV